MDADIGGEATSAEASSYDEMAKQLRTPGGIFSWQHRLHRPAAVSEWLRPVWATTSLGLPWIYAPMSTDANAGTTAGQTRKNKKASQRQSDGLRNKTTKRIVVAAKADMASETVAKAAPKTTPERGGMMVLDKTESRPTEKQAATSPPSLLIPQAVASFGLAEVVEPSTSVFAPVSHQVSEAVQPRNDSDRSRTLRAGSTSSQGVDDDDDGDDDDSDDSNGDGDDGDDGVSLSISVATSAPTQRGHAAEGRRKQRSAPAPHGGGKVSQDSSVKGVPLSLMRKIFARVAEGGHTIRPSTYIEGIRFGDLAIEQMAGALRNRPPRAVPRRPITDTLPPEELEKLLDCPSLGSLVRR